MTRVLLRAMLATALTCAAAGASADGAVDGAAIVKARCTSCHNLDRLKQLAARTPEESRAAKWEKFLPSHNLPKADERAAVIAWLLEAAKP